MEKKDKVLLLLAPVALVAGGYIFLGDRFTKKESPPQATETFSSIEAPISDVRKKRTDIYRDKYEQENGKALERHIESDDSFFGEEIKTDSIPDNNVYSTEQNSQEFTEVTDSKKNVVESESKPKVVVKYIERPDKEVEKDKVVTVAAVKEDQPVRRRTGFVSGETAPASEESNSPNALEVNLPAVVQDDIEVKNGSNIILRTTEEIVINGTSVPKNTLLTGVVGLTDQRLNVVVNTIKTPTKTLSIKLRGHDLDGNEGMPLEGGVDKEIKRDAINDAINATRQIVRSPILRNTPRAGTKKVNDPSVPIPKGYKLILKS